MSEALQLAGQAARAGDVPVGAVVLDSSSVCIGRGRNRREQGDPMAHAEVDAIRQAVVHLKSSAGSSRRESPWNLSGCTLVVTLEPCPMCAGAVVQAHIDRVVFGAWDEGMGACGSVWDIPRDPHVGHRAEVIGGVCEGECASILRRFFADGRR